MSNEGRGQDGACIVMVKRTRANHGGVARQGEARQVEADMDLEETERNKVHDELEEK